MNSQAPMKTDMARTEDRADVRNAEYTRVRPREPHEKFDLPDNRITKGMDYLWAALKVPHSDRRSPRLRAFRDAGWRFARAADFPELSGYRKEDAVSERDKRFIELGIDSVVQADDPVILEDSSVLMMRPRNMSREAEREDKARADSQFNDYMNALRAKSERQIGSARTKMQRTYGPSDEAQSDAEAEI
jgi:hypothetical protein